MSEIKLKAAINDFGPKNLLLIAGVALFLGLLAWDQRPVRLASLDRAARKLAYSGKVLGANTIDPQIQQQIAQIQINISDNNSSAAFQNYIAQLKIVSAADQLAALTANTSADPKIQRRQEKFLEDLKKIAAPSALADYHRLTIAYYSLVFVAQAAADNAATAVATSAISEELLKQKNGFKTSAAIDLP